ncbi:glycoside hydrolase family 19 protein [Photobacterium damselae]|uniref:glycoside hydrolase family 19 protein n=1 Tax=Photobacterium damselae TaxID=38293 RepID=UPI000E0E422F|nr:glycoside hydrolase family 19 protein [Photobacterium damselae]
MMTFLYPLNKKDGSAFKTSSEFESLIKSETIGQFGFNPSNLSWHGGIHFTDKNTPWLQDTRSLQAIADGVVVACRVNDKYQQSQFEGHTLDYSNDFCLLQHTVADPNQDGNSFTFYVLYMHLAPLCEPHRVVSTHPRYLLTKSRNVRFEAGTGTKGIELGVDAIVEVTEDDAVKQDGYVFKPFNVIRSYKASELEGKKVWLATHKEGQPTPITRGLFASSEYFIAWDQPPLPCLSLKKDVQVLFDPNSQEVSKSLRVNSRIKAITQEPIRKGDDVLQAYEIIDNSHYIQVPGLNTEDVVWIATSRYDNDIDLFSHFSQPYQVSNWLMTDVTVKTKVDGLSGRGDPKSNAQGKLVAGGLAYALPLGTQLKYNRVKDCSFQLIGSRMRLMARCQLDPTTPVKSSSGQLARGVWVCVEDEYVEVVDSQSLELNQTHCFGAHSTLAVKAGDAIGYLGRYDVATMDDEAPVSKRHQVHFELLSNEQPPQFFIDMFLGKKDEKDENPYLIVEDYSKCDGFLDLDEPSEFFQKLVKSYQTEQHLIKGTDIVENLTSWDSCKHVIAKHESEWATPSSNKSFLSKLVEKYSDTKFTQLIEHEKERIDNLIWIPEVSKLGIGDDVWNWWPVISQDRKHLITVELIEKVFGFRKHWFSGRGNGSRWHDSFRKTHANVYNFDKHHFVDILNRKMNMYGIIKPIEQIHFLSQIYHESASFDSTLEYSSGRNYDPDKRSDAFSNGNTKIGDGPKFRGRGLIQLTWKNTYKEYSKFTGNDYVNNYECVSKDMEVAIDSSCWFWRHRGGYYKKYNAKGDINILINKEPYNVALISKAVNGGNRGLSERIQHFNSLRKELKL